VFKWAHGSYNPAISDGQRLYLTGHSAETAFVPRNAPAAAQITRQAKNIKHAKKKAKHKAKRKKRKAGT
jgi:hypothetical protein